MRSTLGVRLIGVSIACASMVMFACSKGDSSKSGAKSSGGATSSGAPKSSDGAKAKGSVTGLVLAPGVVQMEGREGLAALKQINKTGDLLLFDGKNSTIASLKPGSVLLIKGLLAKKVLAVQEDDGDIGVLTEPAAVTDVIQDGHLTYDYPVRFAAGGIVNTALADIPDDSWFAGGMFVKSAYASPPPDAADAPSTAISKTFDVKGWTVEVSGTPEADKIKLRVKATKAGNGFSATVVGDGYLQNFDAGGDLTVEHGKVEQLEMINRKLNGTMNFTWSVKLDVADRPLQSVKIDIPVVVNIPLAPVLGGLPFFIAIDGAVLIKPGFGGAEEISYGEFRITYDGTQRFKIHEGTVDPEGNVSGTIELMKWGNLTKVAPIGMVVAFAAPKIELTFGLSKALKTLGDFDAPAAKADKLFDFLGRKVLGNDAMDKLKDVNIEKALDMIKGNEASAYFELISSSGTSAGTLSWGACEQTDVYISATVNASAKLMGQSAGEANKELWKKHLHASRPAEMNCTGPE
jgi:hypothetical protein